MRDAASAGGAGTQSMPRVTLDTSAVASGESAEGNMRRSKSGGAEREAPRRRTTGLLRKLLPTKERMMQLFSVAPALKSSNVQIKSRSSAAHSRRRSFDEPHAQQPDLTLNGAVQEPDTKTLSNTSETPTVSSERLASERALKHASECAEDSGRENADRCDEHVMRAEHRRSVECQTFGGHTEKASSGHEPVCGPERRAAKNVNGQLLPATPLKSKTELTTLRAAVVNYVRFLGRAWSGGERGSARQLEEQVTRALRDLVDVVVWTDRHDSVKFKAWDVLDAREEQCVTQQAFQSADESKDGVGHDVSNRIATYGGDAEVERRGSDATRDESEAAQLMPLIAMCAELGSRAVRLQIFQTLSIIVQSVRGRRSLELIYHSREVMNRIISAHRRRRFSNVGRLQSSGLNGRGKRGDELASPSSWVEHGLSSALHSKQRLGTDCAGGACDSRGGSEDEDSVLMFLSLVRTIAQKLDTGLLKTYFFDAEKSSMPLYTESLQYFAHADGIIRTAVRGITLSIFSIKQQPWLLDLVTTASEDPRHYFRQLARYLFGLFRTLQSLISRLYLPSAHEHALRPIDFARFDDFTSELENTLDYIVEIMALSNDRLGPCLTGILLEDFFRPLLRYLIQLATAARIHAKKKLGKEGMGRDTGVDPKRLHSSACATALVIDTALRSATSDRLFSSVLALELIMPATSDVRGALRVTPCEGLKVLAATCEDERVLCIAMNAVCRIIEQKILSLDDMYSHDLMMPPPPPPSPACASAAVSAATELNSSSTCMRSAMLESSSEGSKSTDLKIDPAAAESNGAAACDMYRLAASPFPASLKRTLGAPALLHSLQPRVSGSELTGGVERDVSARLETLAMHRVTTLTSIASFDGSALYEFDPHDLLWSESPHADARAGSLNRIESKAEGAKFVSMHSLPVVTSELDALSIEPPVAVADARKENDADQPAQSNLSTQQCAVHKPGAGPTGNTAMTSPGATLVKEFSRSPSSALQDAPFEELLYTLFSYEHNLKSARLFVSAGALLVAMAIKAQHANFYIAVAANILRDVSKRVSEELLGREHVSDTLIHSVFAVFQSALFSSALCFSAETHTSACRAAGPSWLRSHEAECEAFVRMEHGAKPCIPRPVATLSALAAAQQEALALETAEAQSVDFGAQEIRIHEDGGAVDAKKNSGGQVVYVDLGGADFDVYDAWAMVMLVRTVDVLRRYIARAATVTHESVAEDKAAGSDIDDEEPFRSLSIRALQSRFRERRATVELKEKALLNMFALTNAFRGDD